MFTGIVEEMGEVVGIEPNGDSAVLTVRADDITDDLAQGASIAINGVCLTVTTWVEATTAFEHHRHAHDIRFDVMGESLKRTALGSLKSGDKVNLEVDMIARYVERMLSASQGVHQD